MTRVILTTLVTTLLAVGLGGCFGFGGGKKVSVMPPPAPPPAAKFEDQFGPTSGFAAGYQQPANSEPREVTANDVIAVNPTAEPVPLPGT